MTRHKVILAFGSNTADRRMKVSQALQFCSCHIDIEKTSPAVETEPVGLESPMFVNQKGNVLDYVYHALRCKPYFDIKSAFDTGVDVVK